VLEDSSYRKESYPAEKVENKMTDSPDLHINGQCNCPKCRGSEKPSSQSSHSNFNILYTSRGKIVIAVLAVGVAVVAGLAIGPPLLKPFPDSPATSNTPSEPTGNSNSDTALIQTPSGPLPEHPKVTVSWTDHSQLNQTISQELVSEEVVLFRNGIQGLSTTIPQIGNGYLEAKIIPEKGSVVEARLYKNSAVYCPEPPFCGFL
jgi:hypothetical protein